REPSATLLAPVFMMRKCGLISPSVMLALACLCCTLRLHVTQGVGEGVGVGVFVAGNVFVGVLVGGCVLVGVLVGQAGHGVGVAAGGASHSRWTRAIFVASRAPHVPQADSFEPGW